MGAAQLWSVDRPHLYTLRTSVVVGTVELDAVNTTFGVRKTEFDPQRGFFLNGAPLKIYGCANHQDFAGVGVAVPDSLQTHRISKLKTMGANAWRTGEKIR
jgi:beta-galactosidase